jgi:hypothetical protein
MTSKVRRRLTWGPDWFNLGARLTRAGLNRLGAEWRNDFKLGTDPGFYSEFYQPLSFDSRLFVAPHITLKQSNIDAFVMDSTVARFRLSEAAGGLDFGRELGRVLVRRASRSAIRRFPTLTSIQAGHLHACVLIRSTMPVFRAVVCEVT